MIHYFTENEIFSGTYQILKEIGHGGSSVVFLAYHLRLQKYVVVKRIHPHVAYDDIMRTEADILKNLHHPYLPQVYDYIVDHGDVFTVMDYIEGQNLQEIPCGSANLSEKTLLMWMRQMAEVLDYLHTQSVKIVHSDIKPANIILCPNGSLCLIDFNISLSGSADSQIKGVSEAYASPEQIALADLIRTGQAPTFKLDERTDIFSLGATFYYLATGQQPNGRHQMPRLQDLGELGYSQPFLAIIDNCMAQNRNDRYPTAAKLIAALMNLKKSDARYRRYVLLKVCSFLLAGLLAGAGAFCTVRGISEKNYENYRSQYTAFVTAFDQYDYQTASRDGIELLNDSRFSSILKEQRDDAAAILHALGDMSYSEGDYVGAADYYAKAKEQAKIAGLDLSIYYRDYAIALAKASQIIQAEQVLLEAESVGVSDSALHLVEAALEIQSGEYDQCVTDVEAILSTATNPEVRAMACETAAEAKQRQGDLAAAAQWLERACGYQERPATLRRLGEAYAELSQRQRLHSAAQTQYAQKALSAYERLHNVAALTFNDYINYSVVQTSLGQTTSAVQTLLDCKNRFGESYYVSMNLAFAYYEANDLTNARHYCNQAIAAYRAMSAIEQAANSDDYQSLQRMRAAMSG